MLVFGEITLATQGFPTFILKESVLELALGNTSVSHPTRCHFIDFFLTLLKPPLPFSTYLLPILLQSYCLKVPRHLTFPPLFRSMACPLLPQLSEQFKILFGNLSSSMCPRWPNHCMQPPIHDDILNQLMLSLLARVFEVSLCFHY